MEFVTVKVHNLRGSQRQVSDPRLFARLSLCGGVHRYIVVLDVPAELHPESALAMKAEQNVVAIGRENEA